MKSKKTIRAERRWVTRADKNYSFQHHGVKRLNQGRIQELVDKHPYARNVSAHTQSRTVEMGRRAARAEKKKGRATD